MNKEWKEETRKNPLSEIEHLLIEFQEKFKTGIKEAEKFITIHEIERNLSELQRRTEKIYRDMVCELMSNINEEKIICKKKRI